MIFVKLTRIYVIITLGDSMTSIKDISYIPREGYSGDKLERIVPLNPSAKTKDSTHIPLYKAQVNYDNSKNELNESEIESVVNNVTRERTNMDINTIKEMMDSGYNPLKEKLLNESENKNKVL